MNTVIVNVPNPNLAGPYGLHYATTEYKDLPRVVDCYEGDLEGGYQSDAANPCQTGCSEPNFQFIVEPDDRISLQFRLPDLVNPDPANPTYGWYDGNPAYFVRLEAMAMDGVTVLWDGPISAVSGNYGVFLHETGPIQNVSIWIQKLLEFMPPGTTCWYFRVSFVIALHEYGVANTMTTNGQPPGTFPLGYTVVDVFASEHWYPFGVWEWTGIGGGWSEVPFEVGDIYWIADQGIFVQFQSTPIGDTWVQIPDPGYEVPGEELPRQYVGTMAYRLRKCDEPIVHVKVSRNGLDCIGRFHGDAVGGGVIGTPLGVMPASYQYNHKLKGEVEVDEFPIETETTKDGRVKSTTLSTKAVMRTEGLPIVVAKRLQVMLAEPNVTVNGDSWDTVDTVKKNNTNGSHWYVEARLRREDCRTVPDC